MKETMEILGFLIVVIWLLPMFMSMTKDNDASMTQGGVIIINIILVLAIMGIKELHQFLELPKSPWLGVVIFPLLIGLYVGMWCFFSPAFAKFLCSIVGKDKNN